MRRVDRIYVIDRLLTKRRALSEACVIHVVRVSEAPQPMVSKELAVSRDLEQISSAY